MSKDRIPEVGDIFESNGKKFTIVALYKWQGNVPTTYLLLWDEGRSYYSINMFSTDGYKFQDCVYLGHSKANIDDLFKTENEE